MWRHPHLPAHTPPRRQEPPPQECIFANARGASEICRQRRATLRAPTADLRIPNNSRWKIAAFEEARKMLRAQQQLQMQLVTSNWRPKEPPCPRLITSLRWNWSSWSVSWPNEQEHAPCQEGPEKAKAAVSPTADLAQPDGEVAIACVDMQSQEAELSPVAKRGTEEGLVATRPVRGKRWLRSLPARKRRPHLRLG